jgi:xanthine/uracil permease
MTNVLEQLFFMPNEQLALLSAGARSWGIDVIHFNAVTAALVAVTFLCLGAVGVRCTRTRAYNRMAHCVLAGVSLLLGAAFSIRFLVGEALPAGVDMVIEASIAVGVSLIAVVFILLSRRERIYVE